jgi:hypothetical protein
MIQKIKESKQKLATQIRYEEDGHNYYRVSDNKLLAGVSSVSSLAKSKDSDGWLAQWKVNEAIEYIKENSINKGKIYEKDEDLFSVYEVNEITLNDSKYSHKEKGKEATDIGTEIHAILQDYVEQQIERKEANIGETEITKLFFEDFITWEAENEVTWLASELLVGDLENDVAGRLDGLAMVNGKLTLIDFKAANNIPSYYFIQLAGYALCLKAMGIEVEDRIIIRLPKTPKRKVWVEGEPKGKYITIDNKIEFIQPKTNWNFDQECFIHAREMYKWLNQKTLK